MDERDSNDTLVLQIGITSNNSSMQFGQLNRNKIVSFFSPAPPFPFHSHSIQSHLFLYLATETSSPPTTTTPSSPPRVSPASCSAGVRSSSPGYSPKWRKAENGMWVHERGWSGWKSMQNMDWGERCGFSSSPYHSPLFFSQKATSAGLNTTRRYLCEALSFQYRYVPIGLLERLPARLNDRAPAF